MQNRWDESVAQAHSGPVGACTYGSRLLGSELSLVLHGGGNTSVKAPFQDVTGRSIDALHVKGSGWDLATIEDEGFSALRKDRLHELLALDALSDTEMMRELSAARLDPSDPQPSVEALLHAFLPYPAAQHSHADAVVSLTNLADGEEKIRALFGDSVVVISYVMPGFDLAKLVASQWNQQAHHRTTGMVLLNHGLFTFGATTQEAYKRHIDLITQCEELLDREAPLGTAQRSSLAAVTAVTLAGLRCSVSKAAGRPLVMTRHTDPISSRFVQRRDLESLATRGPLTPDHVIRTKRIPMVGTDVGAYVEEYEQYFTANAHRGRLDLTMLDPAPRVIVDADLGVLTLGETVHASNIAADIYQHTMPALERCEDHLGGYVTLTAGDSFQVEYWDLEQAKLRLAGPPPELAGAVAVVTGAASGIGRACAAELLSRGCAVGGLDLDPSVAEAFRGPAWLGQSVDVSDSGAQKAAIHRLVERFGGLDIVVVSAGRFGASQPIATLDEGDWRKVQAVNVDAVVALFSACHPLLALSPIGGRVAIIGSKNVAAPGPGASAYSASKAAVTQLGRVAALEWATDGIRVNTVHPDAVFDTGLWTEELLHERASKYHLTVDEYKRRNLLRTEVTSANVARIVAELCSDTFANTTGAQIPIDGGNERIV